MRPFRGEPHRQARRLFVTGTDTGVGKTRVTSLLAGAGRARGWRVVACKPVASGVPPGEVAEDAAEIAAAAGHAPIVFSSWPAPLSPHRAAALAGGAVPDDVPDRIRALDGDLVLVEGVGGWRVPLSPRLWVEDLARATGPDVLLVAANRLGTLNHTLLTLDAVRAAGFRVRAVALNQLSPTPDPSATWNPADLAAIGGVPVVEVAHDAVDGEPLLRVIV